MDEKVSDSGNVAMEVDVAQVVKDEVDVTRIESSEKPTDSKISESKVEQQLVRDLNEDGEVEKTKSPRPTKKAKSETDEDDQISDVIGQVETKSESEVADPICVVNQEAKSKTDETVCDKADPVCGKADPVFEVPNSTSGETKQEASVTDPVFEVPSSTQREVQSESAQIDSKEISGKLSASRQNHVEEALLQAHEHKAVKKLRELGYDFNKNGELRQFDLRKNKLTDKKFEFEVKKGDRDYNQRNYEKLGEVIDEYVYCLLETNGGLKRVPLGECSFIFVSDDLETNEDKLMVLIHGSGVVKAGQWARRLIINDNIKFGTQLPYICKAKESGYSVIVLNTNDNKRKYKNTLVEIAGSETPIRHAVSAWKQYVAKSPAKHVAIVAHSYGGVVTTSLAKKFLPEFEKRVFSIMFTDSVHSLKKDRSDAVANFLEKIALNYVAVHGGESLGTEIPNKYKDAVPMVSAGHDTHEWTSASAFRDLFRRLELKLAGRK